MSQTSTERLRDYLAQLPPKAQALLMREFERAIERGEDTTVATFVLTELRKIIRSLSDDSGAAVRANDLMREFFRPLEPFLIAHSSAVRPGQIRRSSLSPVWLWLTREGIPNEIDECEGAFAQLNGSAISSEVERMIRKAQAAAATAIAAVAGLRSINDSHHSLGRIGGAAVVEDIVSIGTVLQVEDELDELNGRLSSYLRVFTDSQIASVSNALNFPTLQQSQVLPFALSLVMQRLTSPWQIIRLAISVAGSDDEMRVAGTPYAVAVTMAIHDLARIGIDLRSDIKRGQFENITHHLKALHEGMRGLRTELDIRSDSAWGRQMAAIRVETSNILQSQIESVPGRVRRLLRQHPDKDVMAHSQLDQAEVEETVALIDFVAVCRTYASELATNEVTLRTFSDLQHYVESTTDALVESLRTSEGSVRVFREMQAKVAIRFCAVLFGPDYASLMSRAAEMAYSAERPHLHAS